MLIEKTLLSYTNIINPVCLFDYLFIDNGQNKYALLIHWNYRLYLSNNIQFRTS